MTRTWGLRRRGIYAAARYGKDLICEKVGVLAAAAYEARMSLRDELLRDGGTFGFVSRCSVVSSMNIYTPDVCLYKVSRRPCGSREDGAQ